MKRPAFNSAQAREVWRPLYGGRYFISSIGNVKSTKIGPMRVRSDRWGYLYVRVWVNGFQVQKRIHRLVAEAFIGKSKLHVNHINGIKTDNRLANLEYVTCAENMLHAKKHGLVARGSRQGHSKLESGDVKKIRKLLGTMSQGAIAKRFGVSPSTISEIRLKKIWAWLK